MKKISILFLCVLCFVFSSCTPLSYALCFYISPIDISNDKIVEDLEVEFYNINNEGDDVLNNLEIYSDFYFDINPFIVHGSTYEHIYRNIFLYFDRTNLGKRNIKYLDWDVIQPLLDGYKIKVTDPNGVYEDYYTPTLRELLERNEKTLQDIVGRDDCVVTFEFILQKRQ